MEREGRRAQTNGQAEVDRRENGELLGTVVAVKNSLARKTILEAL